MAEETPQVLVIDDSEIAVDGMIQILKSASIPAIGMPSAIGATRTVLRHRIRVVIADVNMPVLTGNNLVSLFRNNQKLAGVKIVLVSGLAKEQLLKMADECGADGVVAKDELDLVLVTTVRRLLPRQTDKR
jgi:CheY-like chemotaxis protein